MEPRGQPDLGQSRHSIRSKHFISQSAQRVSRRTGRAEGDIPSTLYYLSHINISDKLDQTTPFSSYLGGAEYCKGFHGPMQTISKNEINKPKKLPQIIIPHLFSGHIHIYSRVHQTVKKICVHVPCQSSALAKLLDVFIPKFKFGPISYLAPLSSSR